MLRDRGGDEGADASRSGVVAEEVILDPSLPHRHMAAMLQAADNLLRQLASEGVRYEVSATGGTATILHLRVSALTPDTRVRIERCLSGIGAIVIIDDAGALSQAAPRP